MRTWQSSGEVAPSPVNWRPPTRLSSALFAIKVALLQLRRAMRDLGARVRRHGTSDASAFPALYASSRSLLWPDVADAEHAFQLGKVQNLRAAAAALDGVVIPAGEVFSFWKQVGRTSEGRGYAVGRMLQQGCMVPAIGGGLCQLSNSLYDVALQTGCEITERHAHSRIVPGSAAALGRDATVAWNYVDLRFRPRVTVRLEVRLEADELVVALAGMQASLDGDWKMAPTAAPASELVQPVARSCATCNETDCFRHEPPPEAGGDRSRA